MCRMWQGSSGKGMSLGSSGVHASLSWMARVEGPAQPGFLTLSKYFLCWSFNDLVWSPLITHPSDVLFSCYPLRNGVLVCVRLHVHHLISIISCFSVFGSPEIHEKNNWAGPFFLQAKAFSFLPLFLVHTVWHSLFVLVPGSVLSTLSVFLFMWCPDWERWPTCAVDNPEQNITEKRAWHPFNVGHTCQCLLPVASQYQPTPLHPPPSFSFNCWEAEVPIVVLLIFLIVRAELLHFPQSILPWELAVLLHRNRMSGQPG